MNKARVRAELRAYVSVRRWEARVPIIRMWKHLPLETRMAYLQERLRHQALHRQLHDEMTSEGAP